MILTIHGLPPNIKYHELKDMLKKDCNINEFILGSLWINDDGTKSVKVGLTNDKEGKILLKCLDHYKLSGHVLRIVPVGKTVNEILQENTINDTSYQWRNNQQRNNHGSNLLESNKNRLQSWSDGQGTSSWTNNQPIMPQQVQSQSNFRYMQSSQSVQHSQQGSHVQDKPMDQQSRFPQTKNLHQHFGHDESTVMTAPSNFIALQRANESRHLHTNIGLSEQHATIQPIHGRRSPMQSYNNLDKPQSIMKYSFDGSFNTNPQSNLSQQGHFQDQEYNQQWPTHGQQQTIEPFTKASPSHTDKSSFNNKLIHSNKREGVLHNQLKTVDYKHYEKDVVRFSPQREDRLIRRISPPGHRVSPSGHRILPSGRRINLSPSRVQSSDRQKSPTGRNTPLIGRRVFSPEQMISPAGRRISPGNGSSRSGHRFLSRRISPSRRRISPLTHRISPNHKDFQAGDGHMPRRSSPRRMSPMKQSFNQMMSPDRHSPSRRGNSPRSYTRYSPHHISKKVDSSCQGSDKDVRQAYETMSQAQSQPMYSGGYPSNARENVQYSVSTSRQTDQRPLWQGREKDYLSKKSDDDRCEIPRNQKFEAIGALDYPRAILNEPEAKVHSPCRMSRSPNRRDRSPIRDRYRRQSPSPRSPRRSWALEKRRSPDNEEAPPPPMWPERHEISHLDEERVINQHRWEKPYATKDNHLSVARKEERHSHDHEGYFINSNRSEWGILKKPSSPAKETRNLSPRPIRCDDRYTMKQRELRFSPREDYNIQQRNEHQRTRRSREPEPRIDRHLRRDGSNEDYKQIHRRGGQYYAPNERKGSLDLRHKNFNREIEDIFKRSAELTQKTEEYQKQRTEKGNSYKNVDHFHTKKNYDNGQGTSRNEFYESSKSILGRNPEQFREVRNADLSPKIQYKRDKAIVDLTDKMLLKFGSYLKGQVRNEVEERIKSTVEKMIFDMFGEKDVSFIEIVVKFKDKYSLKDMEKIFDGVVSMFPAEIRTMQRHTSDESPAPAKIARRNPSLGIGKDNKTISMPTNISDWNLSTLIPPSSMVPQMPFFTPIQMIVPVPYTYTEPFLESTMPAQSQNGFDLFLYKDNFQVFNDTQALVLKDYIIDRIIKVTEIGDGWTPDLTLRGVLNKIRYEVWTSDVKSKNWLLNLSFKDFLFFNVVVYTPDELWYERAAIWLPRHSKNNILPPLIKLKLQNRHLDSVNVQTWKLVKQIITEKGTRLYVDIPPSSARALESHDMTLSYELQKVHIFLKAVAVDKNAFDAGLEELSVTIRPDTYKQNEAMPAINSQDENIVKICLSNNTINVTMARKIKDALIKQIYEYIQKGGGSRTDFLKYGYCKPGYFCVIPENEETRKWVNSVNIGKIHGQSITICGSHNINTRYITMEALLPFEHYVTPKKVIEKLKLCNRGVKKLKFNLWKRGYINPENLYCRFDVDVESVEALMELKFLLDYTVESRIETIFMECNMPLPKLQQIIDTFKAENIDTLTVTNMEISSSDDDDDDVVCLN